MSEGTGAPIWARATTVALPAAAAAGAWWRAPRGAAVVAGLLVAATVAVAAGADDRRQARWGPCGDPGAVAGRVVAAGAVLVLAALLGARAEAGLASPARGEVAGVATLRTDPERRGPSVHALAVLEGRHLEIVAFGAAGGTIQRALAGERLELHGRVETDRLPPWLARRHVVGRLLVDAAGPGPPPAPVVRATARLHRLVQRGAEPLGGHGPLYRGLVLGDDRDQAPAVRDAFLDAGLSHLTAVSGQNVALVLAIVAPALLRLPRRPRAAGSLLIIGVFVVLTRAEPSVLRAAAMAGVSVVRAADGRRTDGRSALAAAVTVLLLVDPFLVSSVGFWLSVAASGGILCWSALFAARVPGPRWLATALGVTLAAQLATAPILVAVFGSVPLVAVPANVVAAPLAGFVMTWGLTAGLLAGVLGGRAAAVLQAPAAAATAALDGVARVAAALPVGSLRAPHLVAALVVAAAQRGVVRRAAGRRPGPNRGITRAG